MENLLERIGLAITLFASTDIDDLFVLVGFFADPRFKVRQIFIGQYLGIAGLYGASVVASMISLVIPPGYIGLLGLVRSDRRWNREKRGSCARGTDANERRWQIMRDAIGRARQYRRGSRSHLSERR